MLNADPFTDEIPRQINSPGATFNCLNLWIWKPKTVIRNPKTENQKRYHMIIFQILIILACIVISWLIAYAVTMASFWIDLNINYPDSEQMVYMKRKHLNMNKYVWLIVFIFLVYSFH